MSVGAGNATQDGRPRDTALCQRGGALLGRRPDRSGIGRGVPTSGSMRRVATDTDKARAIASRVEIVTFSKPRSTRPTYDRSMPDAKASRSCDKPRSTRSRRIFQPMIARASMSRQGQIGGLTIDGPTVPYFSIVQVGSRVRGAAHTEVRYERSRE